MCGCGWSKVGLAVVVGMVSAASAAVAQADPATPRTPVEAVARTVSSTSAVSDDDMPGAPRLAPAAPSTPKEPTTTREPSQPPPGSTSGPGPTVGATPVGTMPLEAIHRPIVLPTGLVSAYLTSTLAVYSIELTTFSVVPSLGVGLGRGFDLILIAPGVRWDDAPEGAVSRAEPTEPVLALDYELHRDVAQVAMGLSFRPPLLEPYSWAASLDVQMRAAVTPWLALAIGAEATAYDRGPAFDLGTQAEGVAAAAVMAQLGARVAASLGLSVIFDEFTRAAGRGPAAAQLTAELAVTIPLRARMEVALGDDHAWGVVGLDVTFPRLASTVDDTQFRWTLLRYHTLWLGLYL